jgi:uncharacterized tellurite resistance protein B-like protein
MIGFFERLLTGTAAEVPKLAELDRRHVATAALMIEAARIDGHMDAAERRAIGAILEERLDLAHDTVEELLIEAEEQAARAADWHGFTNVIKNAYDASGRQAIVEMLWEVVERDGRLHDLEASLMRRVPALLHLSGRDNAEARRAARARLGLPAAPYGDG